MKCNPDDSAFPKPADDESAYQWGLDKREFFAAIALQGLLAAGRQSRKIGSLGLPPDFDEAATDAVAYADALINALNAPKKE